MRRWAKSSPTIQTACSRSAMNSFLCSRRWTARNMARRAGFFLTAWNGTRGYTFDRIMRGKTHIEAACLSLLGSTQPGRLAEYVRRAVAGGAGDDGLIQRFGFLVWPDAERRMEETATAGRTATAREAAWRTFERLDKPGPGRHRSRARPIRRRCRSCASTMSAQDDVWRLAGRSRKAHPQARDMSPALESHLAKYRKLVPGARAHQSSRRWRGWADRREGARARRWRSPNTSKPTRAAPTARARRARRRRRKLILARIRRGDLRTASRRATSDARNGPA